MILAKAQNARGILFDLPSVVDGAEAELKRAGVIDRCEVVGGSFFESVPEGGDAYVLKSILHDWSDDDVERILRNVRAAIAPGGKLVLLETVLPERTSSDIGVMFDLEMMVALHGRERTRAEWTAVLGRAGFQLDRVADTAGPLAVIEATPV
jgi:hypothetical protein